MKEIKLYVSATCPMRMRCDFYKNRGCGFRNLLDGDDEIHMGTVVYDPLANDWDEDGYKSRMYVAERAIETSKVGICNSNPFNQDVELTPASTIHRTPPRDV